MTHDESESHSPEMERATSMAGDAAGVAVPSETPMPGTSEEFAKADGMLVYPDPDPYPDDEA
jgi:hypothetical protein